MAFIIAQGAIMQSATYLQCNNDLQNSVQFPVFALDLVHEMEDFISAFLLRDDKDSLAIWVQTRQ
ncbi:hypothetical protein LINPERPRIM_LOCUS4960 [Linum perenne]